MSIDVIFFCGFYLSQVNLFSIEIAPKCQFPFPLARPLTLTQYTVNFLYRLLCHKCTSRKLPKLLFYSFNTSLLHTLVINSLNLLNAVVREQIERKSSAKVLDEWIDPELTASPFRPSWLYGYNSK